MPGKYWIGLNVPQSHFSFFLSCNFKLKKCDDLGRLISECCNFISICFQLCVFLVISLWNLSPLLQGCLAEVQPSGSSLPPLSKWGSLFFLERKKNKCCCSHCSSPALLGGLSRVKDLKTAEWPPGPFLGRIFQPGNDMYEAAGSSAKQVNLMHDFTSESDILPSPSFWRV